MNTQAPVMNAPKPTSTFVLPPAAIHNAIIFELIDLGTHEETDAKTGEKYQQRKIAVGFEFHGKNAPLIDNKPHIWHREVAYTMSAKGNLRKCILAATGDTIDDPYGDGYNILAALGKAFTMQLTAGKTAKGNDKRDITSVMPLMDGVQAPIAFNQTRWLSLEPGHFNANTFDHLPEWIKKKVAASPEFAALTSAKPAPATPAAVNGPNDEIPF
jgi:hypothetical protein